MAVSFLAKFIAGGLELGKKCGPGCSRNIVLSVIVCVFSTFKEPCVNFQLL